jgi:hypothetical protein
LKGRLACVALAAVLFTACGSGESFNPPAPFPFAVGTTWTYRQTFTTTSGARVETATVVYKGEANFRGAVYHVFESTSTLTPEARETTYFVWTGTVIRNRAAVLSAPSDVVEVIYDRTWASSGVEESMSGTAAHYRNGMHVGSLPWSSSVTAEGVTTLSTAAGTLATTRWHGTHRLGGGTDTYTAYDARIGRVKTRGTLSEVDSQTDYVYELLSGPVGPAIVPAPLSPGPTSRFPTGINRR